MSKVSSTDGAEDQRIHIDEQPAPELGTLGPTKDSEQKENGGPSAMKLPSGISNTGPSQLSETHEQESASKVALDGDSTSRAEKVVANEDQPTLSELANSLKKVLEVLQNSTIVPNTQSGKDTRSRFWELYELVAEDQDDGFLERSHSDMKNILLISGLFSATITSFIVAMESILSPDPSDTTNALLTQLVHIGLGNLTAAGSTPAVPAPTWSPTVPAVRIQMVAYASLSMSLLAAFGAVLGKQWLGYYKTKRHGRGSQEEQAKHRQEMFNGLVTWHFDAYVQSIPILLQTSLLLFGIALGAHMWYEQPGIAWVIITTTVFGFLFYSLTVIACLISPSCPFQTPASMILRMLGIDKVLLLIYEPASRYFLQLRTSTHAMLQRMLSALRPRCIRLSEALIGTVRATGKFARHYLEPLFATHHNELRSLIPRSSTNEGDSEAQQLNQHLDDLVYDGALSLELPDIPTRNLEAPCIKWLLETSTDHRVSFAAASLVPLVEWPLDLDVSDMLPQLYDTFTSCIGSDEQIVPSLEEKASACVMAMSHLYCGHVLQAYPGRGDFLLRRGKDGDMFKKITECCKSRPNMVVLASAMHLYIPEDCGDGICRTTFWFDNCPHSVLKWLSHCLPYYFVTGGVTETVEEFAMEVIAKLLSSASSPSDQIIANCNLLACLMVGVQFDKKTIIRIDKSAALRQVTQCLLKGFQRVLWASDGGDLEKVSTGVTRRAWSLLDIICRMLEVAQNHYNPSSDTMRNLDTCRRIYLRAGSSEQNHSSVSLAALRNALHFTLTAAKVSRDPAYLWNYSNSSLGAGVSHSPANFDWLVDCYLDIYSNDQEVAFDVLFLLGVMKVSCRPAKLHQFIDSLIACMGSNTPVHLRYAALRAAHIVREEIASIDVIDAKLRDMVLTKLSPAILTAVCPPPGTTLANDPHHFFHYDRDLCYLELIFALARNSNWHPHLLRDDHIDWCISMIEEYTSSMLHAFHLTGILLRIAPEQSSVTLFDAITGQQWWDMMRSAWCYAPFVIDDIHCFEFLLVLVEGTKMHARIASEDGLEELVRYVDDVLEAMKVRGLDQGNDVLIAVEGLRTMACNVTNS